MEFASDLERMKRDLEELEAELALATDVIDAFARGVDGLPTGVEEFLGESGWEKYSKWMGYDL